MRLRALLLIPVLALGGLAACGGSGDDTEAALQAAEADAESQADQIAKLESRVAELEAEVAECVEAVEAGAAGLESLDLSEFDSMVDEWFDADNEVYEAAMAAMDTFSDLR